MKVGHAKHGMKSNGLPISMATLDSNSSKPVAPFKLHRSDEANIDVFSTEIVWARSRFTMNIM